jgi:hypothetical protein
MTTFPDSSVAAQKVAEAHEMSVRFDPFAVSATCHEFIAVEASTSPSLSTAKQVAADTHDTELIVAWSFEYADWSIGLGYVQPPGPTETPGDPLGLAWVVAADALGDEAVDAAALVVGGGVVAAASGVAWCISVSPAAVPPPATTSTAAAIAAHIRRFRRGRSPLPGSGGTGGSTVVAPP